MSEYWQNLSGSVTLYSLYSLYNMNEYINIKVHGSCTTDESHLFLSVFLEPYMENYSFYYVSSCPPKNMSRGFDSNFF